MKLERFAFLPRAVIGRITFLDHLLYTIERPWLDNEPYESCIPEGVYELRPHSGPRFKDVWEVCDVPGRTHILIHAGNWVQDVVGCIAPGVQFSVRSPSEDPKACMVTSSRVACRHIFNHLETLDAPTLTVTSVRAAEVLPKSAQR